MYHILREKSMGNMGLGKITGKKPNYHLQFCPISCNMYL